MGIGKYFMMAVTITNRLLDDFLIKCNYRVKPTDLWFPSSKTCNKCGYINQELQLSDVGTTGIAC